MSGLPRVVGLFGLGLIGSAVARRLVAAGVEVRGHDPDPAAMARLAGIGGVPVAAEAVWEAECVVSAVFDTAQLAALVETAPRRDGAPLVSLSTCDPTEMPAIEARAAAKGVTLIECPISGTSADLAEGRAILLVAGDAVVAERLAPLFGVLSRRHHHVGAVGNGNRAKLAINLVLGLTRAAVAEGMVFAKAVGLEPADFLELALDSAAASKVMAGKGPKMVARDFTPLGHIRQSAKDFGLICDQAAAAGQGLPFAERYLEVMARALEAGEGALDNSAVLLEIERTKVGGEGPAGR